MLSFAETGLAPSARPNPNAYMLFPSIVPADAAPATLKKFLRSNSITSAPSGLVLFVRI